MNAAGLFLLMGAEFLAMILIVVYVGAVAVLFLFVVMMLDVDFAELRQGFLQYLPIGALIGIVFLIEAVGLFRRARAGALDAALKPMRLFHWSNSYLALLFLAAAIDPLIFH